MKRYNAQCLCGATWKAAYNYLDQSNGAVESHDFEDLWIAVAVAINEYPAQPDDERTYDSDDYPKNMPDSEEADSPMHCGSNETCLEAIKLPSGRKVGALLGGLTADGVRYVEEKHGDPSERSEVTELWVEHYSSAGYDIETDDDDDDDDDDN